MLCCVVNSSQANDASKEISADLNDENIREVKHELSHEHLPEEEEAVFAIYKRQHQTSFYR